MSHPPSTETLDRVAAKLRAAGFAHWHMIEIGIRFARGDDLRAATDVPVEVVEFLYAEVGK